MSHRFDCVIDTQELANGVGTVRKHVDATTTAVVGMQTAVIKAQKEGAQRVCTKVNQGFYALIHSQISQKMAKLQSQVDAQLMRLNQQRKQLVAIRRRMEHDYQMISARYAKLFGGLNRNLRQRITELDRPVIDFATTDANQINNRGTQMISVVPLGQDESVKLSQKVSVSNLKNRAVQAVGAIERFIADSNRLRRITDRILLNRAMAEPTDTLAVPVCIMESTYDAGGDTRMQTYISQIGMSDGARNAIENRLAQMKREGDFAWQPAQPVDAEVAGQFGQCVDASGLDARRRKTIMELFNASTYETL